MLSDGHASLSGGKVSFINVTESLCGNGEGIGGGGGGCRPEWSLFPLTRALLVPTHP